MLKKGRNKGKDFIRDESGQTVSEYAVLVWFTVLIGAVTLLTFLFAFEQGIIGYYEDIVNVIALP